MDITITRITSQNVWQNYFSVTRELQQMGGGGGGDITMDMGYFAKCVLV